MDHNLVTFSNVQVWTVEQVASFIASVEDIGLREAVVHNDSF